MLRSKKSKKKPEPDVEFIAQFSLSACVDRLEALNALVTETTSELDIQVDPINSQTWRFKAQRQASDKIIVQVTGSLLQKSELSTLVTIKGYTGEQTAKWVNAIFMIILLVALSIMSILIAAHALALAIFFGLFTLPPLFIWRFVEFERRGQLDKQRLEQLIKRTLE